MKRLLLVLTLLQVLDLLTTWHIMAELGGIEANPLSAALIGGGGFAALVLGKVAFIGITWAAAAALSRSNHRLALRGAGTAVAAYTLVVGWNASLILR